MYTNRIIYVSITLTYIYVELDVNWCLYINIYRSNYIERMCYIVLIALSP